MIKSLIIFLALLLISISPCSGFCYGTETPDNDQDEIVFILSMISIPPIFITVHPLQEFLNEILLESDLKHPPKLLS
jgi:hypothetical protein